MLTPDECRELSKIFLRLAEKESEPHLKRLLEGHGRALAECAAKPQHAATAESPRD
ncbi:MAG TPA: hypothetical protein VN766_18385 [Stellaceae bacterium]|jgi:hypothetical protein|nr:hypothetical protein [Stellaceae bacterium]